MDNAELLRRWHAGDEASLALLLERHLPDVRRRVHLRLGDALRAKEQTGDLVQEAVAEFLRWGPRFVAADDEHVRRLLFRIAENVIRDRNDWFAARRRALARERPLPADTALALDPPERRTATPSEMAHAAEREAWARLALELVEVEEREVIVLRMWDDLPFEEIGRRLGIAPDAARMRLNRAVASIAARIAELRRGVVLEGAGRAASTTP